MLGWEFPPFISGGLGTACYGLTKGLDEVGVQVCFVLPTAVPLSASENSAHVDLRSPSDLTVLHELREAVQQGRHPEKIPYEFNNLKIHQLDAQLQAYSSPREYHDALLQLRRQAQAEATKANLRAAVANKRAENNGKKAVKTTVKKQGYANASASSQKEGNRTLVGGAGVHYEGDLMGQIHRYARLAVELAEVEDFDVIHAHDWMTFPAGMAVAAHTHKPLVVHVHSTEFDRSGENVNQQVYDIERAGMHCAGKVVCVSHLTKRICEHHYAIPAEKIDVVYNAVDLPESNGFAMSPIRRDEKIVLFLGRITMQKGPEYFLMAAKKVVEKFGKVRFVIAGSGDMIRRCIQLAADLNLGRHVTFTGFLRGPDVDRIFEMADLYVMPSVSEPFGIAPLEAMSHNVPVLISKQSGVSEVLTHVLKVDFWDIDEMANKILAVLRHEPLQATLRQHAQFELQKLSWSDSAAKLKDIYQSLVPPAQ